MQRQLQDGRGPYDGRFPLRKPFRSHSSILCSALIADGTTTFSVTFTFLPSLVTARTVAEPSR